MAIIEHCKHTSYFVWGTRGGTLYFVCSFPYFSLLGLKPLLPLHFKGKIKKEKLKLVTFKVVRPTPQKPHKY